MGIFKEGQKEGEKDGNFGTSWLSGVGYRSPLGGSRDEPSHLFLVGLSGSVGPFGVKWRHDDDSASKVEKEPKGLCEWRLL